MAAGNRILKREGCNGQQAQEGTLMVEHAKELPQPEVVTYRREELDLPIAFTGEPRPSGPLI